ncbi:siroheme synthase CysG [Aquitalea sp. LB_tupeE]|uniref:siroheme synthase CysG n=1 Tax=Aquitalea sp. LB_tupeE TaxID=2748078 RepID=UPI0015BF98A8|nr:siroheme synthase CysG [Aquitalea sp. LB_tupeE]NWK78813.1 uroporphyrinogen-III C-methyltransferase [Aquitalea sp. LB_tupeE]
MQYFPAFLSLKNSTCLVVGGGTSALNKVRLLKAAGAQITIVAPTLTEELASMVLHEQLQWHKGCFTDQMVSGMRLVIAATNKRKVNKHVSDIAQKHNILVNVVDDPEISTYITPAIVDRSPLVIAISSAGNVPVLTRLIRAKLESIIPASFGLLAEFSARFRDQVKVQFNDVAARRTFWESVLEGPIAEAVMNGHDAVAVKEMEKQLANKDFKPIGTVYLVGAGPGNPDLLTFRALRLMQQADVVLYDKLVTPELLELVRRDAERIYVGKVCNNCTLPQEDISDLLVTLAKAGKRVLRLKGGDPFIFGRGGEEIETLAKNNISFEVVPGITSANGAASYAGIPLTHQDHAQSVTFVTGHNTNCSTDFDWPSLARPNQTVVVYMGLTTVSQLCTGLIKHGKPSNTPAAVIQWATTPKQRMLTGTLDTLPNLISCNKITSPALIIIGSVVSLRSKLNTNTWQ